jgi:hypothetical protein
VLVSLYIVVHAAIIVINNCIDRQVPIATVNSLKNPVAHLVNIVDDLMDSYQDVLLEAKTAKAQAAHNKVRSLSMTGSR